RAPLDLSVRGATNLGALDVSIEGGAVVAGIWVRGEGGSSEASMRIEPGLRGAAGARLWFDDLAPFVLAEASFVLAPYELALHGSGAVGKTPALWVGGAIGVALRAPLMSSLKVSGATAHIGDVGAATMAGPVGGSTAADS